MEKSIYPTRVITVLIPSKLIGFIALTLLALNTGRAAENSAATPPLSVASPDGRIELTISPPLSASPNQTPKFQVTFQGRELLHGELGLCVSGTNLLDHATLKASRLAEADATYTVPFGKNNPVRNHYRELTLDWENDTAPLKKFAVVFRAYDDGVAYRYLLPGQKGVKSIKITSEPGTFQSANVAAVFSELRQHP